MKVYEAERSDAVEEMLLRFSADWEAEDSCRGYRRNTREDLDGRRIFLAEEDGLVLGYLLGRRETAEKSSSVMDTGTPCFEIEELYVVPDRRSQGIGRLLFSYVEEKLRSQGLAFLTLTAASKNAGAILHFYLEEMGMSFWSARLFKKL